MRHPQTKRVFLATSQGALGLVSNLHLNRAYVEVLGRLEGHQAGTLKLLPTTLAICKAIESEFTSRLRLQGETNK